MVITASDLIRRADDAKRRFPVTVTASTERWEELNFEADVFSFGAEVAGELERNFLLLCSEAAEVTAANRRGISQRQGIGRVLAPLL